MVGSPELESRGLCAAHTLEGLTGVVVRLRGGLPTVACVSPGLFLVPTLSQPALSDPAGPLSPLADVVISREHKRRVTGWAKTAGCSYAACG